MKNQFFVLIVISMTFVSSCETTTVDKLEVQDLTKYAAKDLNLTKSQLEMTEGINRFTYDIYKEVYGKKDIMISPFSISLALSMLTTGADGDTEKQLLSALGFEGKSTKDLDTYYSTVMSNMASADPETTLSIANAIWSSKSISLKSQYINDCKEYFGSTAESVDLSDPSILNYINNWAKMNTGGKIEKLFDTLPNDTGAILANALYFKALWPFEFTRSGKRMRSKVKTSYFEGENFSGITIPYGNGTFAMRIILPSKGKSLEEMVMGLDELSFSYSSLSYEIAIVSLDMPVFSFSYENSLDDVLRDLGVKNAYEPNLADFSKMSDTPLYVDNIIHKTFVDVNENGTEAAAVTAIVMEKNTFSPGELNPREIDFKVDRDFLFEIIDSSSGVTLFIGQKIL